MLENRMISDYYDYEFNTDKYDEEVNALEQRDDEEWEEFNND